MTLVLSVIVIAIVGAAYAFVPSFGNGTRSLAEDVRLSLTSGAVGGVGLDRDLATDGHVEQGGGPFQKHAMDPRTFARR